MTRSCAIDVITHRKTKRRPSCELPRPPRWQWDEEGGQSPCQLHERSSTSCGPQGSDEFSVKDLPTLAAFRVRRRTSRCQKNDVSRASNAGDTFLMSACATWSVWSDPWSFL